VATLTDDPYWKDIYTQGSYGKMPKNFVYSNGVLGYSKGIKKYRSVVIPQDPGAAFHTSIQFFRENGLMSERDSMIIQNQEEEEIPDGYMQIDSLLKIKRKKTKFVEFVLRDFAYKYCKRYNLPQKTKELFNVLFSAYKNKCLNDIVIQNQELVGIIGVSHTDTGEIIYQTNLAPKQSKVKYNPIIEVTDPQFSIRSRTRVDMAKTWFNWVSTVNQELGHKETRIVYDEVTATGTATETE
jgi:hypothetical protein